MSIEKETVESVVNEITHQVNNYGDEAGEKILKDFLEQIQEELLEIIDAPEKRYVIKTFAKYLNKS